jgi:hypothetical protein
MSDIEDPIAEPAPELATELPVEPKGTDFIPPAAPPIQQRRAAPALNVYAAVFPIQSLTLPKEAIVFDGDNATVPLAVNGALGVFPVFASAAAARELVGPDGGIVAVPFRASFAQAPAPVAPPPPPAEDAEVGGKLLAFKPK